MSNPITPPKLTKQQRELEDVIQAYKIKFPFIDEIQKTYEQSNMITVVNARFRLPDNSRWEFKFPISDVTMESMDNFGPALLGIMFDKTINNLYEMGEEKTGKYPLTRLYADYHLKERDAYLFHPNRKVPGWIHDRYRHQKEYPKERPAGKLSHDLFPTKAPEAVRQAASAPVPKPEPQNPWTTSNKETEEMAKGKVKIVKKQLDPKKVNKPRCQIHDSQMEFSSVDGKWHCMMQDCKMVARPKRDPDDKTVTLGKGGVQLRLIVQEGMEPQIILVSDDNLALNISDYVDIQEFKERYDIVDQMRVARENGKTTFRIITEPEIPMHMPLTVMLAD